MKTIITSTDFSPESQRAVEFAADVAFKLNAKLIIFNDISVQPVWSDYPTPQDVYEKMIDLAKSSLSGAVREMKKRTKDAIPIESRFNIGQVSLELQSLCEKEKPFAVFIASHMKNALERILFGNHAVDIARYNSFPVIVVPSEVLDFSGFRKIALAIDLKNPGDVSWDFLNDWLRNFNPQLDIVYVDSTGQGSGDNIPDAVTIERHFEGFLPKFHFINNHKVEAGINEYVQKNHPDLLIVHPKKHGLFGKKESNSFILRPPVPLMTFPSEYNPGEDKI